MTSESGVTVSRRVPVGVELLNGGGAHIRVWAPRAKRIDCVFESATAGTLALEREADGYFAGVAPAARAGDLYRFRLDEGDSYPDPASRFQPQGPHGPSEIIDPSAYPWHDASWHGVGLEGQIIYELHAGTFTQAGTWVAALDELDELARLGITVIELMPVADFPGAFGWGYDGVNLFAPTRLYGRPDDLRRFIDEAHQRNIGVILDVVYNHLGPDGNYLRQFSSEYFSDRYQNEWGLAINYDGPGSQPVREFFRANARYWIEEFHFDGLRLDATQQIFDESSEHILAAIGHDVRKAAWNRAAFIVAENEPQDVRLIQPIDEGGMGLDGLWNDDYHHTAVVALTGRREAYFTDYLGTPQELLSASKRGFLYQGQYYSWQKNRRGTPALSINPERFVHYIQNHDQIANSLTGDRLHVMASPGQYRAITALTLLGPATPLLFQGQEFCASTPFYYFADHNPELAEQVRKGRREFMSQFRTVAQPEVADHLADPGDVATFRRSKLDFSDRQRHAHSYALHEDLIRLRRNDPVLAARPRGQMDGAVLGPHAFVLRFFAGPLGSGDRLLVVNLGRDLSLNPMPEPLLAPPEASEWRVLWSSEDIKYGGSGTPPLDINRNWLIPADAAVMLSAVPQNPPLLV